jgi:16S rRNA (guanine966-N2)-methyltransferase
VREAVFARLGDLRGCRVLDLFAGTGALGVEAVSRGAESVVFVEQNVQVLACLRENLAGLQLEDRCRTIRSPVKAALERLQGTFDLVFLDPPYAGDEATGVLATLATSGLLAAGAALVVESPRRHPPGEVAGLERLDERAYGDTMVVRYTCGLAAAGAPEGRKATR